MIFFVLAELKLLFKNYQRNFQDKAYNLAAVSLFEFMSFRLPASAAKDRFLALRVFKNVLYRIFVSENKVIDYNNNSGLAIIDNSFNYIELRNNYAESLTGKKIEMFFCKDQLFCDTNFFQRIKLAYVAKFVLLRHFSKFALSNKQRCNYALLIREIPEIINLATLLKKRKINTVIDFSNYEADSNFLFLVLKKFNIKVYKVPSPGPLYMHNKIILTDYLVISSGYHIEELDVLGESLMYEKVIKYIPEMSPLFTNYYLKNEKNNEIANDALNTIGFYSHGSWIRHNSDHADNGLNLYEAERTLLKLLKNTLLKHKNYKLIVFLHPREKLAANFEKTKLFYDDLLRDADYIFAPTDVKSVESFNLCNIAAIALSTILFERLLMRFKTIIFSDGSNGFPMPSSVLNNITFKNEEELADLIYKNLEVPSKAFFDNYNLNSYIYSNLSKLEVIK